MSATVLAEFVYISWNINPRFAGDASLYSPGPTITYINGTANAAPDKTFALQRGQIVISGTNLDLVTAIQFEICGPTSSGWPDYTSIGPGAVVDIRPPAPDPFWPEFIIDSPSQITILASMVEIFANDDEWFRIVLTY
jgi:hypothetical protein